jgi:hypothetical protein
MKDRERQELPQEVLGPMIETLRHFFEAAQWMDINGLVALEVFSKILRDKLGIEEMNVLTLERRPGESKEDLEKRVEEEMARRGWKAPSTGEAH